MTALSMTKLLRLHLRAWKEIHGYVHRNSAQPRITFPDSVTKFMAAIGQAARSTKMSPMNLSDYYPLASGFCGFGDPPSGFVIRGSWYLPSCCGIGFDITYLRNSPEPRYVGYKNIASIVMWFIAGYETATPLTQTIMTATAKEAQAVVDDPELSR